MPDVSKAAGGRRPDEEAASVPELYEEIGLVQPLRAGLAGLQHPRRGLLPGGFGGALSQGRPEIFNTDQGGPVHQHRLHRGGRAAGARVSMDGGGWALDNIFHRAAVAL